MNTFTFNTTSFPLDQFIGYDNVLKRLELAHNTLAKGVTGNYPPYNIVKLEENKYVIELAVAGISRENIDIETHESTITVSGKTTISDLEKEGLNITYLHKGIADRSFTRKFTLAETVVVKGAELVNGMLRIYLENVIPEDKRPKKVEIVDSFLASVPTKTLLTEEKNG